tara:strand:+ start:58 stop:1188 length:1131 start_codon:yes stop_codon:yes gene_type:complete
MAPMNEILGNLKDQTFEDIWNSDKLKKMRVAMINDKPTKECTRCYSMENSGLNTTRTWANEAFENHFDKVGTTQEDGTVEKINLPYIDFRFSNLCNFKCRTCGPDLSSSWYEDNVKLYGPLNQSKIIRPYKDEETFWQKVEPYMDGLEEIYFAGGEPLIMEEHYRILKKLDERKMYHVRLKYNTNFSIMTYKKLDVMEIWSRFESVKIGASLDGMGKRGEYLRKGQSWQQVEDNRKRMFDVCPDVYVFLATCLNVYNCFHVPDFHHEWIQRGWVDAVGGSLINPLFVPEELSIQVLPLEIKKRLEERYIKEQEWFDNYTNNKEKRYEKLIHFMYEKDHSHLLPKFWERTDMVDKLRNENFIELFPELSDLRTSQQV